MSQHSGRVSAAIILAMVATPLVCLSESAYVAQQTTTRQHVRIYFVAADEVNWDYGPSAEDDAMGHSWDPIERAYMEPGPHTIGRVYGKVVYREYFDAKFTRLVQRQAEQNYLGILGPIFYAEVGDTIKVVFRNNASRPFSIHPHGVLYLKDSEGAMYSDATSDKDKGGDAVPPGGTYTYIWEVPERAGPRLGGPSSMVWLYHSHVDELRDVASGLFGAIVVTAHGKARPNGHPIDVDREFVTMMMTINENESWYLDENIRRYAGDPGGVNKKESVLEGPDGTVAIGLGKGFVDTNMRYTINGYMFGNMPMMTMKKGERVRWYLLTLGDSNNIHTPHWHGNTVVESGRTVDVLDLAAGQSKTVDMVPDNPGIWLFHCHFSDHMAGGMVARYKVEP